MEHIKLALSVLKEEIYKVNYALKYEDYSPEEREELMDKSGQLHRAVNDIKSKFKV